MIKYSNEFAPLTHLVMKYKSYPLELPELFRNNPDLREFIQALKYEILESLRPPDQQVIDDVDLR